MRLTMIVIILLINVEKKNTIARRISSFKNVKKSDHTINVVTSIP